jgi:hypothetical protein
MVRRLDAIVRATLETLADLPLRVTDEHWMQKLDELDDANKATLARERPRRAAKQAQT